MSKFLYSRFHEQMEEELRANSAIAGQSDRAVSTLSYNNKGQLE